MSSNPFSRVPALIWTFEGEKFHQNKCSIIFGLILVVFAGLLALGILFRFGKISSIISRIEKNEAPDLDERNTTYGIYDMSKNLSGSIYFNGKNHKLVNIRSNTFRDVSEWNKTNKFYPFMSLSFGIHRGNNKTLAASK